MGVPLVLPHTSLANPASSLRKLEEWNTYNSKVIRADSPKQNGLSGDPRTIPIALFARFSRNFRLSRVKPTCLTTV